MWHLPDSALRARELVASIFNRFDRPDRHNRRYLPYVVGGLVLLFFAGLMFLFLRLEQRSALTSEQESLDHTIQFAVGKIGEQIVTVRNLLLEDVAAIQQSGASQKYLHDPVIVDRLRGQLARQVASSPNVVEIFIP